MADGYISLISICVKIYEYDYTCTTAIVGCIKIVNTYALYQQNVHSLNFLYGGQNRWIFPFK